MQDEAVFLSLIRRYEYNYEVIDNYASSAECVVWLVMISGPEMEGCSHNK